ncbi:hypothetical protein ACWEKR_08850 [Nocardia sp. NPDC004573]
MGLADEEGWDDPTPIQRFRRRLLEWEALSPEEARKLLRARIPAAFPADGYRIRRAYIEYLRLIGDPQWQQRMTDLDRSGFHRYWADYDPVVWGPWREPATPLQQYLNALKFCDEDSRVLTAMELRNHGAPAPVAADGEEICRAWCQLRILIGDPRGPQLLRWSEKAADSNPAGTGEEGETG